MTEEPVPEVSTVFSLFGDKKLGLSGSLAVDLTGSVRTLSERYGLSHREGKHYFVSIYNSPRVARFDGSGNQRALEAIAAFEKFLAAHTSPILPRPGHDFDGGDRLFRKGTQEIWLGCRFCGLMTPEGEAIGGKGWCVLLPSKERPPR